ncbi:intracellular survival protein CiaI [Campylobacter sp. US33a]|uniref:Intracellular survival protein CiaI n=1 Tax=Campylobacter sp. CCS1377 TaxID=3158229 RepID=A0AAU7E6C6_9BACT|nr:intracellular survival protein CiaI [Campylobacter sp. US33a]MCW1359904.1 ATP-binding protein [Campylobacter jejuni]TEY03964.1 ATP-binding protein [Campylobacter sp. US33a]
MQVDISKNQNFSMDYTTKSGKHLSLAMYDNQSINYNNNEEGKTLNLKRQYGFSFSFEGSKLTQNELDEIKNAMEEIKPLMQEFLANSKVGELNPKELITSAMQMADVLPTPKDENHKNAIMNNFTNKLNNLIKENQSPDTNANTSMLEDSKKLIEEILEQMKKQLEKQMEQQNEDKNSNSLNLYA